MAAAEESTEGSCLEQNRLPSESVEHLPDVHKRKIENPQHSPRSEEHPSVSIEQTRNDQSGKEDSAPCAQTEGRIRRKEEEQTGRFPKRNFFYEQRNRQQPAFPQQRLELIDDVKKADEKEHSH